MSLNIDLASVMQAGRWKSNQVSMRYGEHVPAARREMARATEQQGRDDAGRLLAGQNRTGIANCTGIAHREANIAQTKKVDGRPATIRNYAQVLHEIGHCAYANSRGEYHYGFNKVLQFAAGIRMSTLEA